MISKGRPDRKISLLRGGTSFSKREPLSLLSGGTFVSPGYKPYGTMTNDTGNTVTISGAGTWVEASDTFTTWTAGKRNQVTFGDSHYLQVKKAGTYIVIVAAALEGTTAGDKIGIAAAVNGTAQTAGHAHSTIGNANDQVGIASSWVLDLAANDEISMAVTNHTAARDVNIIHASVSIMECRR